MVYDADGSVHKLYEVGSSYGNIPPTYVIIDQQGVIRYRTDDTFNQTEAMGIFIRNLLKGGGE